MNSLGKEEESLRSNIAALHVTYYHTQDKIMWFGQLASKMPLILKPLQDKPSSSNNEMVSEYLLNPLVLITTCLYLTLFSSQLLHIHAVNEVLLHLQPPLFHDRGGQNFDKLKTWINQLRLFQITVNAVLSLSLEHSLVKQTRYLLQKVQQLGY